MVSLLLHGGLCCSKSGGLELWLQATLAQGSVVAQRCQPFAHRWAGDAHSSPALSWCSAWVDKGKKRWWKGRYWGTDGRKRETGRDCS